MSHERTGIDVHVPPSGDGCVECLATGSWWLHLRRCAQCGHVGCCDDSLNRHASRHAHAESHPVIQTFEPDEDWFYDYRNDEMFDGPRLAPPTHHPTSQPTPGPAGVPPRNWQRILMSRDDD